MDPGRGPLAGIRIVEFDAIGPLPLAGMLLADMGADVVRIVRPKTGNEAWGDIGGEVLHRSRTAVELDLKSGQAEVRALVARADAVIEGFRPGVMERLGLGPDACLAANPQLVYGRITGWGQSGPLARRAGHDINYIGLTGALHAIGEAGVPPPVPLNMIGDYGGGTMFLIAGLLAALLSARLTGRGQVVDAAMTDGVASMSAMVHAFRASGQWGDERGANLLDGGTPFYRCYACADGKFVAVGALEPQFFALLLAGLGIPADSYVQHDRAGWPEMVRHFAGIFAARPRDAWAELFAESDACVTPVLDWAEAPRHPHNADRNTFVTRVGLTQPAPAPRFSATPGEITFAREGSVTEVLSRWAGKD